MTPLPQAIVATLRKIPEDKGLWKVDDASSAELMYIFYQILLQGGSKTVALSNAQQTFLARVRAGESEYRMHPYFWAAFHLIGDVEALV
jgi:CHAT domain-containing protein